MVGVAQRIERQTVALDAGGSNPLTHPFFFIRRGFEWSEDD